MDYYETLAGCDLGVFPSFYEPWGYTPLESAAYAVPTITSDQAGFGLWVEHTFEQTKGIMVLERKGVAANLVEDGLYGLLEGISCLAECRNRTETRQCPQDRRPCRLEGLL